MTLLFRLVIISILITPGCEDSTNNPVIPPPDGNSLRINEAFPLLDFNRPVDLQSTGDNRLFVVEQKGVIQVFINDSSTASTEIFLDIQSQVDNRDNEEGLLGMAFHPDFLQNGYFYVNYTAAPATTRVSRFKINPQSPNTANASTEIILLEFSQPFGNHNGGQLAFGPDGYLYISVGDGGSGGDPQGHGQNTSTLLGSILRIDIDKSSGNLDYSVPSNNPFVGNQTGEKEEIFAYGLRNPWRMSFDRDTGNLWAGDVGQNEFEEIDIIEIGGNYGWKIMEADDCFESSNCDQTGLIAPYFLYSHDNGDASLTGGGVYRGPIDSLNGWYIYADYVSGKIWALETGSADPVNQLLFDTAYRITAFGMDSLNELYFCSQEGKVYTFSVY